MDRMSREMQTSIIIALIWINLGSCVSVLKKTSHIVDIKEFKSDRYPLIPSSHIIDLLEGIIIISPPEDLVTVEDLVLKISNLKKTVLAVFLTEKRKYKFSTLHKLTENKVPIIGSSSIFESIQRDTNLNLLLIPIDHMQELVFFRQRFISFPLKVSGFNNSRVIYGIKHPEHMDLFGGELISGEYIGSFKETSLKEHIGLLDNLFASDIKTPVSNIFGTRGEPMKVNELKNEISFYKELQSRIISKQKIGKTILPWIAKSKKLIFSPKDYIVALSNKKTKK